jgi:hypothetical protein
MATPTHLDPVEQMMNTTRTAREASSPSTRPALPITRHCWLRLRFHRWMRHEFATAKDCGFCAFLEEEGLSPVPHVNNIRVEYHCVTCGRTKPAYGDDLHQRGF